MANFRSFFLAFAISCLVLSAVNATEEEQATPVADEAVVTLDSTNFSDVISSNPFVLVEFYAPWCGHCKRLAPEFEKAAAALKKHDPPIVLAKVDANEESNKGLAQQYDVRGYPTLKIIRNGENVQEYKGPREADGIVQYLKRQVGPASAEIKTAEEASTLIDEKKVCIVGVFSSYESEEYKNFTQLSESLRSDYDFGHTLDFNVLPLKDFPLKAPAVRVFKPFDERVSDTQEFSIESLETFINEASIPLVATLTKDPASHPYVIKFFNAPESKAMLFVNFTTENGEKLKSSYEETAKDYKGKSLRFLVADLEAGQGALQYFGLKGENTPTVLIQDAEERKYVEEGVDVEKLSAFLKNFMEGKAQEFKKSEPIPEKNDEPVKVVVGHTFKEMVLESGKNVLLEFYAPWCGHCKQLAPTLDEVAVHFENDKDVVIAKLDGTANDIPSKVFDVKGYPTLYMVSASGKLTQYEGDRTKDDIIDFINKNKDGSSIEDVSSKEEAEAAKDEL